MLDQIKVSLDSNPNLTDELRDMIYGLTVIFNKSFPDIRLKNLSEKLKTLNIVRVSKYLQQRPIMYNVINNEITINLEELSKDHDVKHLMMFALLQVITSNGNNTGFDVDKQYEALNAGYTEIIASNLVGNESDNEYFAEQAVHANIIGIMVGADKMHEAYFFNKPKSIIDALEELGVE
jgi:hypothetical protein